ncbi:hypothetical protein HII31_04597 [Pseudocercospora fuligena]|uniref:Stress response RCI peptide n=1 Tax=Pseudocercospora fuligena TaxID=685502 RepID=A0A8H6RPV2_9PEZI|nr:hypothetical protein HII31_04597 [Pseudocercospora fuligena]
MTLGGIILAIGAIFLPPVAVFIRTGCGSQLLLNILLCFLGWIPGILHAWYVILEYPSARQRHRIKKARRQSLTRETVYVPPATRTRSRSRSVGGAHPAVRTRSRSVGRRSGEAVYAGTRQPYYSDEYYSYDQRAGYYPPPPRSKY